MPQRADDDDDSKNPNTDYENDEFEDASKELDELAGSAFVDDEDIDDDDDFHLPKKHKQNLPSQSHGQQSAIIDLKKQLAAKRQREQAKMQQSE